MEMSSGHLNAKGIRQTLFTLTYILLFFVFSAITLTWHEPFFLIVEFKPPTIKPIIITCKDLFAKRGREDKSTEIDSSKAPLMFSPSGSPFSKKIRLDPSVTTIKSDSFVPLAVHGYNVGAKPSTLSHLLNDMLLPRSMESQSAKPIETILDDSASHAFHVSLSSLFFVFVLLFNILLSIYMHFSFLNWISLVFLDFSKCNGSSWGLRAWG